MMLYTKNAINVFNVALIAPVVRSGPDAHGLGDNHSGICFKFFKNNKIDGLRV